MTSTERMRIWRSQQPKRKCKELDCHNKAEFRSQYCAECSVIRRQLKQDIYRYDWKKRNPKKVRADYEKHNMIKSLRRGARLIFGITN